MPSFEAQQPNLTGKLIALEGNSEAISTHLRLLPPSHKILVLPDLQSCVDKVCKYNGSGSREIIRKVHETLTERFRTARSFLQSSTSPDQPRLVFMNGGTLKARSICIDTICRNETNGDIEVAETKFNDLTQDGVIGLLRNEELSCQDRSSAQTVKPFQDQPTSGIKETAVKYPETSDDVIGRKFLGEKYHYDKYGSACTIDTASFGNLDYKTRQRKLSEPLCIRNSWKESTSDSHQTLVNDKKNAEKNVIWFQDQDLSLKKRAISVDREQIVRTTFTLASREAVPLNGKTFQTSPKYPTPLNSTPFIPGAYLQDAKYLPENLDENTSPTSSGHLLSTPTSEEMTRFNGNRSDHGASLLWRPASAIQFSDVKSHARTLLSSRSESDSRKRPLFLNELKVSNFNSFGSDSSRNGTLELSGMTSTESPTSPHGLKCERRVFIDKGCDAEEPMDGLHGLGNELHLPMFEVTEDIIIHFADSATNATLKTVLRSYQENRLKILQPTSSPEILSKSTYQYDVLPSKKSLSPKEDKTSIEENSAYINNRTSYGSYNTFETPLYIKEPLLPTPAMTPPKNGHTTSKEATKILTFSAVNSSNIISAHNCFRRLLSSHLPSGRNGYSQYYQSVPLEMDRLWKPVFGNWNISECVLKKTSLDQIIAFGYGSSVENDFQSQISGMIERLGTKRSGQTRSGKIDISYLISNAMQNFNSLSFNQHISDPLSEPSLVASLLVPQLESYFACNSLTQVLVLQFPSTYLPIVLSLRELLGSALFKIAGISAASNITSTQYPPSPVSSNPLSNEAVASRNTQKFFTLKYGSNCSPNLSSVVYSTPSSPSTVSNLEIEEEFFGADFVLSNAASDEDITRFVSDIRQVLLEKSNFYIPEPEPEPRTIVQVVEKYIPAPPLPITRPSSQHHSSIYEGQVPDGMYKSSSRRQSTKTIRHNNNNGLHTPLSDFIAKHNYAASIASSRRTYASSISADYEGWENFEIGDGDSDFDDYDRMILGSQMAALVMGKQFFGASNTQLEANKHTIASKRKALKWLGLA